MPRGRYDGSAGYQGNSNLALLQYTSLFTPSSGVTASTMRIGPADVIASARLAYTVVDAGDPGTLHEMAVAWASDVTWNTITGGPGVRGRASFGPSLGSLDGRIGTHHIDVTASLRRWHVSPASNFGWVLLPSGANGVEMESCESPRAATRPQLRVGVITAPIDSSCIQTGMDFGNDATCGYATVLELIDNSTRYDPASTERNPDQAFYNGPTRDLTSLRTAADCQRECLASPYGCSYFTFEVKQGSHGVMVARCALKAAFPDPTCNRYVTRSPMACGGGSGQCSAGPATCTMPPSIAPPPAPPPRALPPGTTVNETTIYQLQHVSASSEVDEDGACFSSSHMYQAVRTSGVVTAIESYGFYMQVRYLLTSPHIAPYP